MPIRVVRLGSRREAGEGVRLGTVRRPPRAVPREEHATRDYYDVWIPELAPSAKLLSWATATPWTDARWKVFVARYRRELSHPAADRLLQLLAALSNQANFAVGCYCEDESRCHRAVLRAVLADRGAVIVDNKLKRRLPG